ncbi:spore protease YyaC [Hathewaya histolytica]|uniref:spore protease YyaC n=1 Tax=Hathewaya histolytica TaxID=1498 RepID=UPI003B67DEED
MSKVIIDSKDTNCIYTLRDELCSHITPILKQNRPIVIICIGTDRSTGDSLGPLVGEKLRFLSRKNIYIFGNLENPIHAKNIEQTLEEINSNLKDPYIIAIDACLGRLDNVGSIIVEDKPISPGAALNKNLPKVGNLSVTGIVNISGAFEFMVLQNTRLFTVVRLSEKISSGIYHSIIKTVGGKNASIINL